MTEVFVAGPVGPAKKNQWAVMTNDKNEAINACLDHPEGAWTYKQVPPENLRPRWRGKRRGS